MILNEWDEFHNLGHVRLEGLHFVVIMTVHLNTLVTKNVTSVKAELMVKYLYATSAFCFVLIQGKG